MNESKLAEAAALNMRSCVVFHAFSTAAPLVRNSRPFLFLLQSSQSNSEFIANAPYALPLRRCLVITKKQKKTTLTYPLPFYSKKHSVVLCLCVDILCGNYVK